MEENFIESNFAEDDPNEDDLFIGELSFDCFDGADDTFASFLLELDEDRRFAGDGLEAYEDDPSRETMLALYNASVQRMMFSVHRNPSCFRVIRVGYGGRTFAAEYIDDEGEETTVTFNYRQCLFYLYKQLDAVSRVRVFSARA